MRWKQVIQHYYLISEAGGFDQELYEQYIVEKELSEILEEMARRNLFKRFLQQLMLT